MISRIKEWAIIPAISGKGCCQNELKTDNAAGKKEWVRKVWCMQLRRAPTTQLSTKNSLMGVYNPVCKLSFL
jgi:hypothetical protein